MTYNVLMGMLNLLTHSVRQMRVAWKSHRSRSRVAVVTTALQSSACTQHMQVPRDDEDNETFAYEIRISLFSGITNW